MTAAAIDVTMQPMSG